MDYLVADMAMIVPDLERVGLQLHEQAVLAGAAVHAQQAEAADAPVRHHCLQHLPRLRRASKGSPHGSVLSFRNCMR